MTERGLTLTELAVDLSDKGEGDSSLTPGMRGQMWGVMGRSDER